MQNDHTIKIISGVALFIPLVVGIFQYSSSVSEESDKNYRTIVQDISSKEVNKRLSSIASLLTYIEGESKYREQSINILVNQLAIEENYNVINAIIQSMRNLTTAEKTELVREILNINRSIFDYQDHFEVMERRFSNLSDDLETDSPAEIDKMKAKYLNDQMLENFRLLEVEIIKHRHLTSMFFATFMRFYGTGIKVAFNENSIYSVNLYNVNLSKSDFTRSSFWSSNYRNCNFELTKFRDAEFNGVDFIDVNFRNADVQGVIFRNLTVDSVDFSGSSFNNTFFFNCKFKRCNFTNTRGIVPEMFYGSCLNDATFDPEVKKTLETKSNKITDAEYIEHLKSSELYSVRYKALVRSDGRNGETLVNSKCANDKK